MRYPFIITFNLSYIITTWHVLTYLKSLGEETTIARNRQPSMIQMHVHENLQNLRKQWLQLYIKLCFQSMKWSDKLNAFGGNAKPK
jgi:hypothetical protein